MSEMKSLTLNDVRYDSFVDHVARELAGASAVIKSAAGERIVLSDASGNKLYGLIIYGKTTQSGIPTRGAPVELVSAGDGGGVTVTIAGDGRSQSLVVETPNGLLGIPVSDVGNYVDANGLQWVGDEIDLERGVYVQRTKKITVRGSSAEKWTVSTVQYVEGATRFDLKMTSEPRAGRIYCLCDVYKGSAVANSDAETCWCNTDVGATHLQFRICTAYASTVEELKALLQANPVTFIYQLDTPIETALSDEEIATYNSLRTYRGTTTVTNDAGVYMELEYAMDAKTYIDSVIAGATGTVRLTEVTLPATAWTGSDSLYSQVVSIDGITQYSKVDLLPSVEQLAIFHNKDVAFVTENEDGVVTVYAIGDKPTNDYVIQASITEVAV